MFPLNWLRSLVYKQVQTKKIASRLNCSNSYWNGFCRSRGLDYGNPQRTYRLSTCHVVGLFNVELLRCQVPLSSYQNVGVISSRNFGYRIEHSSLFVVHLRRTLTRLLRNKNGALDLEIIRSAAQSRLAEPVGLNRILSSRPTSAQTQKKIC